MKSFNMNSTFYNDLPSSFIQAWDWLSCERTEAELQVFFLFFPLFYTAIQLAEKLTQSFRFYICKLNKNKQKLLTKNKQIYTKTVSLKN